MAGKDTKRDLRATIEKFRTSDHWAVSLARDLAWIVAVVGGIALALYLICGTWPAVVTIESHSMDPHMNVGDLVLVVQKDRYGAFHTWTDGLANGLKYKEPGDVVIYKPNGRTDVHPIIHRAIQYVDAGPVTEFKGRKLAINYTAPNAGYITWGDNNPVPDQLANYAGIGTPTPVKDEWIVGKALFAIPLVGYLPLNIWLVAIIAVVIMILHEMYLRSRENEGPSKMKSGKKRK